MRISDVDQEIIVAAAERGQGITFVGPISELGLAPVSPSNDKELSVMMNLFGWESGNLTRRDQYFKGASVIRKLTNSGRGFLVFSHGSPTSESPTLWWFAGEEKAYRFVANVLKADPMDIVNMFQERKIYTKGISKWSTFLTDEVGKGITVMAMGEPVVSVERLGGGFR